MRRERDRDRGVDARQLLDDDCVRDRVRARAAVLLGDRHPHQPELGELRDEVVGEALLAVELGRDRSDAVARELAHGLANELLLLGEVEVQAASARRARRSVARRSRCRPAATGSRRATGRGTQARRCRGAPTAPRRRTPSGTPPRARRRPRAGRTSSSCRRISSRRSGGSADGAGSARGGRRSPRAAARISSAHASSLAKKPA